VYSTSTSVVAPGISVSGAVGVEVSRNAALDRNAVAVAVRTLLSVSGSAPQLSSTRRPRAAAPMATAPRSSGIGRAQMAGARPVPQAATRRLGRAGSSVVMTKAPWSAPPSAGV
jgi:hypothetical protein